MKRKTVWPVISCLTAAALLLVSCAPAVIDEEREGSEKLVSQIDSSSWIAESLEISPDSQRVAYVASVGNKWLVIVDGEEGKQYDGIGEGSLIFSPDSQRVAYAARVGNKLLVVVDGEEGKQYDDIVRGGRIVFDSPDSLHYLALKGNRVYLVEENVK